ncbi:hypothetical protein [Roseovarius sp. 2305UL8-3]
MKKRWMTSVIEASKSETVVLPFQRGNRRINRQQAPVMRKSA